MSNLAHILIRNEYNISMRDRYGPYIFQMTSQMKFGGYTWMQRVVYQLSPRKMRPRL